MESENNIELVYEKANLRIASTGSTFFCIFNLNTLKDKFEIISEDEEIDIDSIEEIDLFDNGNGFEDINIVKQSYDRNFENITQSYNELLKAVKQLNKINKKGE